MQPHNRTPDIEQPPMKPVPLPQIDSRHPCPPASVVATVIPLDRLDPKISHLLLAILAETDVDQEVAVVRIRFEIRRVLGGGPGVDGTGAGSCAVPAAELARAFGFVVEGGTQGDYALDLALSGVSNGSFAKERDRAALGNVEFTRSGANNAIRTVIHPPWLVPSTKAFLTPRASITCRFMIAVSQ